MRPPSSYELLDLYRAYLREGVIMSAVCGFGHYPLFVFNCVVLEKVTKDP
jgi:hypothetical protein